MINDIAYQNAKKIAKENDFKDVKPLDITWKGYDLFKPYFEHPEEIRFLGSCVVIIANEEEARFPSVNENEDILESIYKNQK